MMTKKSRFTPSYLTGEPVSQNPSDDAPQHSTPQHPKHIRPREIQHMRKVKSKLTWRWRSTDKES